jgi:adenylate cyclase
MGLLIICLILRIQINDFIRFCIMTQQKFGELISIMKKARYKAVNTELINLYWQVGEYISRRINSAEWGDAVVSQLAEYLQKNEPELKGFSDKNLWRMKQF